MLQVKSYCYNSPWSFITPVNGKQQHANKRPVELQKHILKRRNPVWGAVTCPFLISGAESSHLYPRLFFLKTFVE